MTTEPTAPVATEPLPSPKVEAEVHDAAGEVSALVGTGSALVKETKSGYKTTEFWLTIAGAVLAEVGALPGIGGSAKTFVAAGLAAVYSLSRGIAKNGIPFIGE